MKSYRCNFDSHGLTAGHAETLLMIEQITAPSFGFQPGMIQVKVVIAFISERECDRDVERFYFGGAVCEFVLMEEDFFEGCKDPSSGVWFAGGF